MHETPIHGYNRGHELFDPKLPEINFSALKSGFPFFAAIFTTPFKVTIDGEDYIGKSVDMFYQAFKHLIPNTTNKKKQTLSNKSREMLLRGIDHNEKPASKQKDVYLTSDTDLLKDLLRCKFTQHPPLLCMLLRSNAKIVSDKNKSNPNFIGRLLMELRADFRVELNAYASIRVLTELSWAVCDRLELYYTHPRIIKKITTDMLDHYHASPRLGTFLTKKKPHAQDYDRVKEIQYLNFSLSKLSLDIIQDLLESTANIRGIELLGKSLLKSLSDFLIWLKNILDEQAKRNIKLQSTYKQNKSFNDNMNAYKEYMDWTKKMQEDILLQEMRIESAIDEYIHTPQNMQTKLCQIIVKTLKKHSFNLSFSCPIVRLKLLQEIEHFIARFESKKDKAEIKHNNNPDYWLAISLRNELTAAKPIPLRNIFDEVKITKERKVLGARKSIQSVELCNIIKFARKHFEPTRL